MYILPHFIRIYPIFVSGSSTEGIRTWIWPVVSLSDGLDNACLSIRHMAQLLQACNAMPRCKQMQPMQPATQPNY